MILVILAGALAYGVISFLVVAIVWMFTTFLGLVLLGLFVLVFIGNLLAPAEDDQDEEDT